jgi:CDP-paratose 2-epimerase
MKILITGGCGFIGSNLAIFLKKNGHNVFSLDNLYRAGSELNLKRLKVHKIYNYKTNINNFDKIMSLPAFNLIIDCCAEPSVEISRKSTKDAKRVFDTNLVGTFNIIQKCILEKTKIIFLSTSRVYSILSLKKLVKNLEIKSKIKRNFLIDETFNTSQPNSLYGLTKLASEMLITEAYYSNKLNYIINIGRQKTQYQ